MKSYDKKEEVKKCYIERVPTPSGYQSFCADLYVGLRLFALLTHLFQNHKIDHRPSLRIETLLMVNLGQKTAVFGC